MRVAPLAMCLAALAGVSAVSADAVAQPRAAAAGRPVAHDRALRGQLGVPLAQRLLASDDLATRVRGIERLGAIGTTEAIDALVEAMDQGSVAARDPRARLTAVRVLAGEVKRDNVRQFLLREVTEAAGSDALRALQPLAALVRATAALALARSGDKKAVGALVGLALTSASSELVTRALRTYPPASLDAMLEGQKHLTPQLATLLGDLGDLRAIDRLRALLTEGEQAAKIAAAVALARMGDEVVLATARDWMKKSDPRLRRAAADIFIPLDASLRTESDIAIHTLLQSESTRDDGLRLLLAAPSASSAPVIGKLLPTLAGEPRDRAIAALGRAGFVEPLLALVDQADAAVAAAFAIATAAGTPARAALEGLLAREKDKPGDTRRLVVRAGVVRALVLDDAPAGLRDALRALYAAPAPADRAAGAFGLVALGLTSVDEVLRAACGEGAPGAKLTCDARAAAAARGALALPDGAASLSALLPWLKRSAEGDPAKPSSATIAFGAALLAHGDGADLPTSTLAAWAEAGGPLAPLAARALPSRDDEAIRGRVKRLLASSDPVVRAHVAIGLGRDREASAVSLLTSAYRFEDEPEVRRGIVRGLSRRTEVQREATLVLARDLDPDDETRALARRALDGYVLDGGPRPALGVEPRRSVAWITIGAPAGAASRDEAPRAARLTRADGVVVPAVADPDGVLLVPGLPPGLASVLVGRAN